MPPQAPQDQTNPPSQSAQASEDHVKAFMALDEGSQRGMLEKMSPESRNWLMLGVRAMRQQQAAAAPPPSEDEDKDYWQAGVDRAIGAVRGLKNVLAPTSEADYQQRYQIAHNVVTNPRVAARQARKQFLSGVDTFKADPRIGALKVGQSAVTAASALDPFATASVVDINDMTERGHMKEALGTAAFDLLSLWSGSRTLRGPLSGRWAPSKTDLLASAIGETGKSVKNMERIQGDLAETAKRVGKPQDLGDLKDIVEQTSKGYESEFQQDFAAIKKQRIYTPFIRNHITRILGENPQWAKTDAGRARIAAMQKVMNEYDVTGWTLEEFNKERSTLRKEIRRLYDMAPTDERAALARDAELEAKKVVTNVMAETVNDWTAHASGKPRFHYDILRQKQEAALDVNDRLDSYIEQLRDKEASHNTKGPLERVRGYARVGHGGPRVGISEPIEKGSTLSSANKNVRRAFRAVGPSPGGKLGRAAVLAIPLSNLTRSPQDRQFPPPPTEEDEEDQPPQQ